MVFWLVVIVAAVLVLRWARRRPSLRLWWTTTIGARRAWASRALGSTPTFGALQRAVLAEALRHRTVSVTGSVWLPASLEVDLAEEDLAVIAHAPGPFLRDLAEVLTNLAATHQWRLDRPVTLHFARGATAPPGLPEVAVRSLSGEAPAPAPAATPAPAPAARPTGDHRHRPPAALPATTRGGLAGATMVAAGATMLETQAAGAARGLLLDPETEGGAPIVLGGADTAAVIGRTGPADVVVADPTVSAQHCRLVRTPSGWAIEDLGSSNGTLVNGEPIDDRRPLAPGDVVGLGRRARYRVHL
jgi:predicted component of type VI protein secretion system